MNPLYTQQLLNADPAQQQGQPQPSPFAADPIANGVVSALDSARLSFQRRQQQQQDAFSKSLAAMAQAAAQQSADPWGSSGKQSLFRTLGAALPAGVQAYQTHEDEVHKEQKDALEKAWSMQKTEQQLAEQQRHHQALEALKTLKTDSQNRLAMQLQKQQEKEMKEAALREQGFIPVGDGDKEAAKLYRKETYELQKKLPNLDRAINAANNLERVLKKWEARGEDIGTDYAAIVSSVGNKEKGGISGWIESAATAYARKNMNPEKLKDLQLIDKNASILISNSIQAMGGGRVTDMQKRIETQATPGKGMSNQAALIVNAETRDFLKKKKKFAIERRKAQAHGFELPYSEPDDIEEIGSGLEALESLQPETSTAISPSPSGAARMVFPDGTIREVPAGDVNNLLQMGGALAQ